MGRKRAFDTEVVIARAAEVFAHYGYHGTSIDQLLRATGIARASLYQAFGSKRHLFLEALRHEAGIDLVLVALMDMAADDAEVRACAAERLGGFPGPPERTLGKGVLERAGLREAFTDTASADALAQAQREDT